MTAISRPRENRDLPCCADVRRAQEQPRGPWYILPARPSSDASSADGAAPETRYHDPPATIGAREESSHVATAQPAVKLTYDDYCAAPADNRYELLDGELIVVPAPNTKHQRVNRELTTRLDRFISDRGSGELFYAPFDVVLSDSDIVQPDLLFVSREREHMITAENMRGAPDLVIEILSPSTADKDRGKKRTLYGKHGVTEYWLVDPAAETVQIHRLQGETLIPTRTFGREETLRSPLLSGLELHLDDIFLS